MLLYMHALSFLGIYFEPSEFLSFLKLEGQFLSRLKFEGLVSYKPVSYNNKNECILWGS